MLNRIITTALGLVVIIIFAGAAYLEWADTAKVQELRDFAVGDMAGFEAVAEPSPLPPVRLTDAAGAPVMLDDYEGKVLLVNLWATWCAPCRHEMPGLDRLQEELGGEFFEVVIISLDKDGPELAEPFLKEIGIKNLTSLYHPSGEMMTAWGITGLPTTFLVNADGRQLGRTIGPAVWDSSDGQRLMRKAVAVGR